MLILFIFSSLFTYAFAQTTCVAEKRIAPALPGLSCQPGTIETNDGNCCDPTGVQTVGASTASTTFSPGVPNAFGSTTNFGIGGNGGAAGAGGCVDLLNPRTGVSDCPARASLCNDPNYYSVMLVQCPATCNFCTSVTNRGNTVAGGCVDRLNPKTGTSDCPQRAAYCNNPVYNEVMNRECPLTCKRCGLGSTLSSVTIG